jgi:hypothetical protein
VLKKDSKIYIAGHKGLVGSSVLKLLKKKGYKNLFFKKSKELDLRKQADTFNYLRKIKPEFVIICAARVGGIKANKIRRAEFIYDNLSIQNNLIHGSFMANVKNLIFSNRLLILRVGPVLLLTLLIYGSWNLITATFVNEIPSSVGLLIMVVSCFLVWLPGLALAAALPSESSETNLLIAVVIGVGVSGALAFGFWFYDIKKYIFIYIFLVWYEN